jgi:hypothetical protein
VLAWQFDVPLPNVSEQLGGGNAENSLRTRLARVLNSALGPAGFELKPKDKSAKRQIQDFIPLEETLAGARAAGMSVGDYVERNHNKGATQETIDQMASLGVFQHPIARVSEIGPGSGRYLERVVKACQPGYYEIYETARDWAAWLVETYHVTSQPCDGVSLVPTPSQSIDLVHAHKLFVGLPFLLTCHYLAEMARITRDAGWIVFDVLSEDCMQEENLAAWYAIKPWSWEWTPTVMPKRYLIDYLGRRHAQFAGSFFISLWPGKTEVFAFRKGAS